MTHLLPPPLLRLFVAGPPLERLKPLADDTDLDAPPRRRTQEEIDAGKVRPLEGVAAFLERARQEIVVPDGADDGATDAAVTVTEMRREARARQREETKKRMQESYDPKSDTHAKGDPFKTLFLSRLPYHTTEGDLHREFGRYGPIENIRIVRGPEKKSHGYAFILYDRERDMRTAYSRAEGVRIDGRRIMVDVERGRTVKDWKPMRLGGGLGGLTRKPKEKRFADAFARGGLRGGRGGFRGRGGFGGGFRGRGGFGGAGRDREGGFRDRDAGFRDRDAGYRDRDAGYRGRDSGYRDRDAGGGYRDRDAGYRSRDTPRMDAGYGGSGDRDAPRDAGHARPPSGYDDRMAKRPRY
ncbi:hypothetical protein MSPP1_000296 [Malassezia sp. CBS 17886]|nr:hypothetical protein MSPP1_000296 [Malassezia sp. CBS 17886]